MNKMPRATLLIILTLVLLVTGCSASSTSSEPSVARVGEPAPDFQFKNSDGQTVSLSDLRGKPVLMNFWATWCPSCRSQLLYMQEKYEEWSGKGLILLAVNVGESPSRVGSFVQSYNLSLPVLLDINEVIAWKYNIIGYPTTFFIDKDGIIQGVKIGAFRSKEEIEEYLSQILP